MPWRHTWLASRPVRTISLSCARAATDKPSHSDTVRGVKRFVLAAYEPQVEVGNNSVSDYNAGRIVSPDLIENVTAFIEKRPVRIIPFPIVREFASDSLSLSLSLSPSPPVGLSSPPLAHTQARY